MARTVHYYLDMTHTVLLQSPISAEIRTVDSHSDLRILLIIINIINDQKRCLKNDIRCT